MRLRVAPLAALLTRRAGLVLIAALFVSAIALWPATRLRLDSDLASLVPRGTPAAEDYRTFLTTFGGLEKVFIMVTAPAGSPEDSQRLTDAAAILAENLRHSPEVRSARAGFTEDDEAFFIDHVAPMAPLLLGAAELRQ